MTTNKKNLTPNQQSLLFQTVFFVIVICIVLWLLYYNFEHSEHYTISLQTRSIEKDGFCVLYNPKYINLFDSFGNYETSSTPSGTTEFVQFPSTKVFGNLHKLNTRIGYVAKNGWDPCTGVGRINGEKILDLILTKNKNIIFNNKLYLVEG